MGTFIFPNQKLLPFETTEIEEAALIVEEDYKNLGALHIGLCEGLEFTSQNQLPVVASSKCSTPPHSLCALYRLNHIPQEETIGICPHFFTDDRHFESIWNQPYRYIKVLSKYQYVLSTDFSLYMDMLRPQKFWNDFRNKLLAAFFQHHGIDVIPAPSWADINDIERYMEGWPSHSMIAINSTGIGFDRLSQKNWKMGYDAVLEYLQPIHILRYGVKMEGEREDISTYYLNNNRKGK